MKLSIVILCWNDLKVIPNCLESIYSGTRSIDFEVIVSDNGSTDGSIEFIRKNFPQVQVIENGVNLRFAKANNVGIRASQGEYVLILNPDTIIHDGALDGLITFADAHPEAGAFGCRVLNPDGSYQESARPFPSLLGECVHALYLRPLGYLFSSFLSDTYIGWNGDTQKQVDWLSGCSLLARRDILLRIGGFDEQFFYYYEDTDLCRRIWDAGYPLLFTPEVTLTHLGGQSTKHFRIGFALDSQVTRYRYFYKHYGKHRVHHARTIALASLLVRRFGYTLAQLLKPTEQGKRRLEMFRALTEWNYRVDPVRLVENGEEPEIGIPLTGRVSQR